MRVLASAAVSFDAQPVAAVRASQRCNDYWFLMDERMRPLVPGRSGSAPFDSHRPPPAARAPLAPRIAEIGALSMQVVGSLKERAPRQLLEAIDLIVVCFSGFEAQFGTSLAGKIQQALAARDAFPFALGQMDGCASLLALQLARAWIEGPERCRVAAVVAGDAWLYPYLRSYGEYAQYGDGAVAMLVAGGPDRADRSIEIVDVMLDRYAGQRGPFDGESPPWFLSSSWAEAVGQRLRSYLTAQGLRPGDLQRIDSPGLGGAFVDAVGRAAGLQLAPARSGLLASADPLLALHSALQDERAGAQSALPSLCWTAGLNGEIGACLYRDHRHQQGVVARA